MESFLRFYEDVNNENGFSLSIYHSSISEWCIEVGYKRSNPKFGEKIVNINNENDMDLAFAKAQVELKKWFIENKGGY